MKKKTSKKLLLQKVRVADLSKSHQEALNGGRPTILTTCVTGKECTLTIGPPCVDA
ncbi:MAG TPA: class I lanthipeptide [Chitinophaga sp.]|uniref:class I lanthipeptide n=1 Tax=Chitinophaga sp. TaxID=1869181 RepID=UPI002BF6D7AB|nr:class I lanthipeptide [Chitinophaga sp.]HVI46685.1 class I lanthipeptide [Chitinophaga sp.]